MLIWVIMEWKWVVNLCILASVMHAKISGYRKYGVEFRQLIELNASVLPLIKRCDTSWRVRVVLSETLVRSVVSLGSEP